MVKNIDFSKPLVIYGAGSGGRKTAHLLKGLGYNIEAFIDSDSSKWNSCINGITVYAPDRLYELNGNIIIASIYELEIENSIKDMLVNSNIIMKEECIVEYASEHMREVLEVIAGKKEVKNYKTVIIGAEAGLTCWGVEQYTKTLADIFKENEVPFKIFAKDSPLSEIPRFREDLEFLPFEENRYWDNVKEEIGKIVANLPCIIFDNWQHFTLMAAILAKRIFPDEIQIISIVHNNLYKLRKIVGYFKDEIDYMGGVSKKITEQIQSEMDLDPIQLYYKESPIYTQAIESRYYEMDIKKPIRLAYGGRLIRTQKRAHLLADLILLLEENNINYALDIAGIGECEKIIKDTIAENQLEGKVHMLGAVMNEDMPLFWKEHDIFINLSDIEGVSLSMLEAMVSGCVPIVTRLPGVEEYVNDGYNGYLYELNELWVLADRIKHIEKNRILLSQFGILANMAVVHKNSFSSYFEYFNDKLRVREDAEREYL